MWWSGCAHLPEIGVHSKERERDGLDEVIPEPGAEEHVMGGFMADIDGHEQRGNPKNKRQRQRRPGRQRLQQNQRVRAGDQDAESSGFEQNGPVGKPAVRYGGNSHRPGP